MANTLEDLYLKYVDNVGNTMEDDRYFQYLYAMVEAGNNVLQQKHQILNKVVDERWLSIIEDSLDDINAIIDKPRRFVTTSEEVVPVALAKKISADSVRHLSMNTQFIGANDDGEIQPTKILNVSFEESYDLYENRFIYHLISRLISFVDKRTDLIFWSTENETSNTLSFQSHVDDAYEQIDYKIQMTIKNVQNLVENDNDNLQVFMRIDRVRRLVFALRNSSFYSLMNGCSVVRSPIQRTNLMMKDPHYRACYKLWQFIESYDEVGYTIEPIESSLQFDEEYLIQMYTNMITNYTIFKSILDRDNRDLIELEKKEYEVVKPKFVKEVQEQIVLNRDVPDVEVRRVFVEEVTQAQLDAEAKVEKLQEKCDELKEQLDESEDSEAEAQRQMQGLYSQLSMIMEEHAETEDKLENLINEKDQLDNSYKQKIEDLLQEKETALNESKESYETKISDLNNQYTDEIDNQRLAYETKISDMLSSNDQALDDLRQEYEVKVSELTKSSQDELASTKQAYEDQLADVKKQYDNEILLINSNFDASISKLEHECKNQITQLKHIHEEKINSLKLNQKNKLIEIDNEHKKEIVLINQNHKLDINGQKKSHEELYNRMQDSYDEKISKLKKEHENELRMQKQSLEDKNDKVINQIRDDFKKNIDQITKERNDIIALNEELNNRLNEALKAQKEAEAKVQKNSLSHYILSKLRDNHNEEK